MWRLGVGIAVGLLVSAPPLWALRVERPVEFYEWNTNTFTQLNNLLLGLWNITNGRNQLEIVTADPDASRRGEKGESVLYDNAGSGSLCINMNGATDWDCAALTD